MVAACNECGSAMREGDFYVSRPGRCKECVKARVRENRAAKADYYRAYDRKRYRDDPKRKAHCQAMARTVPMERLVEMNRERREREPEKFRARNAVNNALRDGKIKRQPCFFCQSTENLHAHHEDYDHPLDVVWLCAGCHGKLHAIKGDFRRAG